jgi:hypothetical protein
MLFCFFETERADSCQEPERHSKTLQIDAARHASSDKKATSSSQRRVPGQRGRFDHTYAQNYKNYINIFTTTTLMSMKVFNNHTRSN